MQLVLRQHGLPVRHRPLPRRHRLELERRPPALLPRRRVDLEARRRLAHRDRRQVAQEVRRRLAVRVLHRDRRTLAWRLLSLRTYPRTYQLPLYPTISLSLSCLRCSSFWLAVL